MKKEIKDKGITLIALVITIIVMLILIGVTIKIAIGEGLIDTASEAVVQTEIATIKEQILEDIIAEKAINRGTITEQRLDEILSNYGEVSGTGEDKIVSTEKGYVIKVSEIYSETVIAKNEWTVTIKPETWDNDKITAITDGKNVIPLPEGYEISREFGENAVSDGLVIKDSKENEFIWIPVETPFVNPYKSGEPVELTNNDSSSGAQTDSQATLDYYYGNEYYNYSSDFAYTSHYTEMVESVNKYNGFYISRYETTITQTGEIGTRNMTEVLTSDKKISKTNNKECRWWGLYFVQRNSDVVGNGNYVQTNMIWNQQHCAILEFIGDEKKKEEIQVETSEIKNSGEGRYEGDKKDEICNIRDLRINASEWDASGGGNYGRAVRDKSLLTRVISSPYITSNKYRLSTNSLYKISKRITL